MKKIVETFIGVPCSGKSSKLNEYDSEKTFVISRDDIRYQLIKNTDFSYSDLFLRPGEGDVKHDKLGIVTESGEWSKVAFLNKRLIELFDLRTKQASLALNEGNKVVVDLVNLTKKERNSIKEWFKDIKDVEHHAVVFDYENNLDVIKKQLLVREKKEDKSIPFFVIENMILKSEPIEDNEFAKIIEVDGLKGLKEELMKNEKKPISKIKKENKSNSLKNC